MKHLNISGKSYMLAVFALLFGVVISRFMILNSPGSRAATGDTSTQMLPSLVKVGFSQKQLPIANTDIAQADVMINSDQPVSGSTVSIQYPKDDIEYVSQNDSISPSCASTFKLKTLVKASNDSEHGIVTITRVAISDTTDLPQKLFCFGTIAFKAKHQSSPPASSDLIMDITKGLFEITGPGTQKYVPMIPTETSKLTILFGQKCKWHGKGDANCDDKVDLSDFEMWRRTFAKESKDTSPDFDGDGTVGLADFELWRKGYFESVNTTPTPTCIPVPSCMMPGANPQCMVKPPPGGAYCPIPLTPRPSCAVSPPCVYGNPRCLIAEPLGGWCPISVTPAPTCTQYPPCLLTNPPTCAGKFPNPPAGGWCPISPTPDLTKFPPIQSCKSANNVIRVAQNSSCNNIQDAVNIASDGARIEVMEGQYLLTSQNTNTFNNESFALLIKNKKNLSIVGIGKKPQLKVLKTGVGIVWTGSSGSLENFEIYGVYEDEVQNELIYTDHQNHGDLVRITNNYIHDSGRRANGILSRGPVTSDSGVTIDNNIIEKTNVGISVDVISSTIDSNTIQNNSSHGISIAPNNHIAIVKGNTIQHNRGSGISFLGTQLPSLTVDHNTIVYNGQQMAPAVVLSPIPVENNAGISLQGGGQVTIKNTIVAFNSSLYGISIKSDAVPTTVSVMTLDHNDVYTNAVNYGGITDPTGKTGNISADPLFDPMKLCLLTGSPALYGDLYIGRFGKCQ